MAIKERDVVLVSTNESNDTIIDMPVTRENCVEGLGRIRGTAYSVGDVALCAGSMSLQLICAVAGTTSTDELDITGNAAGDSIADGTVTWIVAKRNYFNNDGVLPISDGGTGATTAKQARENLEVEPIGTIYAFAGNNIPSGYLPCNGSAISRTTYADLFAVIGTTYGAGDGSTTFNLPNLTDKFIQGSDTAGTVKSAGLPNIIGKNMVLDGVGGFTLPVSNGEGAFQRYDSEKTYWSAPNLNSASSYTADYSVLHLDASRSNSIYGNSATVQPPALTMRYIIKY